MIFCEVTRFLIKAGIYRCKRHLVCLVKILTHKGIRILHFASAGDAQT